MAWSRQQLVSQAKESRYGFDGAWLCLSAFEKPAAPLFFYHSARPTKKYFGTSQVPHCTRTLSPSISRDTHHARLPGLQHRHSRRAPRQPDYFLSQPVTVFPTYSETRREETRRFSRVSWRVRFRTFNNYSTSDDDAWCLALLACPHPACFFFPPAVHACLRP